MAGLAIEPLPLESPLVLVDVGARGGADSRWRRFGRHVAVIAIDADEDAARSSPRGAAFAEWTVISAALSDGRGSAALHITRKPGCSSVLRPDRTILGRFPDTERFDVTRTVAVELATLDDVLAAHGSAAADFLKVDTQGSELAVLRGGARTLASTLGVEVEAEFVSLYEGQPLFADVDDFLRGRGFELFDLNRCYWRRRTAAPLAGGRGQIIFADALYLRSPEYVVTVAKHRDAVWKAVMIAGAYGYRDYGLDTIDRAVACGIFRDGEAAAGRRLLGSDLGARFQAAIPKFVRGRNRLARGLERLAEIVRADSWAYSDQRLGNSRKS